MCSYDRPFKTYDEQIKRLKEDYKLNILEHKVAQNMLCTISYYDLINGYKECFMTNDKFHDGISIEYLFSFCVFDKNFQNILFKYSIYVENAFKTKLAHIIAREFGVDECKYLDKNLYTTPFLNSSRRKKLKEVLKNIKKVINHPKTDDPTRHYKKNHNHIPPWILLKNVYFNDTIDFYSFLPTPLKKEIVKEYFEHEDFKSGEELELFMSMITIVRKFRNKIAHNAKVITYKCTGNTEIHLKNYKKITLNNFLTDLDIKNDKGKKDLFSMILSLVILLNNSNLLISLLQELSFLLESSEDLSETYSEISGLPPKLNSRLISLYNYVFPETIYSKLTKE